MSAAMEVDKADLHAELVKESAQWNENKALQGALGGVITDLHEDLRRSVAKSEALKSMDTEQAQRVQAYYFKAKVASAIGELTEKSDPMNAVKEELLREIAQRDALDAQESEQFRRTLEAFKHEVADEVRRTVAAKAALGAVELEKHQRITQDAFHEIGSELRKVVAAKGADAAVATEQMQRIQADYFKKMVAGHIAKESAASPPAAGDIARGALRAQLLREVTAVE